MIRDKKLWEIKLQNIAKYAQKKAKTCQKKMQNEQLLFFLNLKYVDSSSIAHVCLFYSAIYVNGKPLTTVNYGSQILQNKTSQSVAKIFSPNSVTYFQSRSKGKRCLRPGHNS